MTQQYFVYENWTHKRGRIHKAECSYCNNGKGTQPSDSGKNGRWHGPYNDRDMAFKKATSLNQADVGPCKVCGP